MKLKKWIKYMDSLTEVIIWGDDEKEPLFKGHVFCIPWYLIDLEIGRKDSPKDEPIYIYNDKEKNNAIMVINVIE